MGFLSSLFGSPQSEEKLVISTAGKNVPDDEIIVESVSQSTVVETPELPDDDTSSTTVPPADNFFSKYVPTTNEALGKIEQSFEQVIDAPTDLKQLLRGIAVEIYQDKNRCSILARSIALRLKGSLKIESSPQSGINESLAQFFGNLREIVAHLPEENNNV